VCDVYVKVVGRLESLRPQIRGKFFTEDFQRNEVALAVDSLEGASSKLDEWQQFERSVTVSFSASAFLSLCSSVSHCRKSQCTL